MYPDITASVNFFSTEEGGRNKAVSGQFYGCPMFIDNEGFDCRLILEGESLSLGVTYEVKIKFLSPDIALPKLSVGKEFFLWEGKNVAKGNVVRIFNENGDATREKRDGGIKI